MPEIRFRGSDGSAVTRTVTVQAQPQTGKGIAWWTGWNAYKLTDAELSRLRTERRTRAIVLQVKWLYGADGSSPSGGTYRLGGSNKFTGNPAEVGTGVEWAAQRQLRDTRFIERAAAFGIDVFLGFYADDYYNARFGRVPLKPWMDDAQWNNSVLPSLAGLAGAAKLYGAKGLALDSEDYAGENGSRPTWEIGTDPAVHAKVRQRGKQAMEAMAAAFPGVELLNYFQRLPGSFDEYVRRACAAQNVDWSRHAWGPFYLGMAEAAGWGRIEFWDSWFYKHSNTCVASGFPNPGSVDAMVVQAKKMFYDWWTPRVPPAALSKTAYANFSWINGLVAGSDFEKPVTVEMARELLVAARDRGESRYLPVYTNPVLVSPIDSAFSYVTGAPGGKSYLPVFQEVAT